MDFDTYIPHPRLNGFTYPPHPRQIFLILYVVYAAAVFFTLSANTIVPMESTSTQVAQVALYSWMIASLLFVVVCGGLLTYSNPVDPNVLAVWELGVEVNLVKADNANDGRALAETAGKYCLVCKAHVFENSLHCRYCDKCVSRLDHHCFYVNNCIGKGNYKLYIANLVGLFLFSSSHAIVSVVSCVLSSQGKLSEVLTLYSLSLVAFQAIVGISGTLSFGLCIFMVDMLRLHGLLYMKGMTTLEYSQHLKEVSENQTMSIDQILCPSSKRKKIVVPI
ncbi:DHHC palmitoyltransferase-domain-containing protein [Obelidium mucronatum]|nr:DHHC palmitoyltransferase-domain-containing protein [Obelidium mucronatum]